MTETIDETTRGSRTMTAEPQEIIVTYPDVSTDVRKVKRLSVRHVFKLARILSIGASMGVGGIDKVDSFGDLDVAKIGTLFGAGVINAESIGMELLADLISAPVDTEYDKDGEVVQYGLADMSPDVLLDIAEAVIQGDDVVSFLERCKAMASSGALTSFKERMGWNQSKTTANENGSEQ